MYGIRTMMWVMLLLLIIIYCIGVALRQLIGPEQAFGCHEVSSRCTNSQVYLDHHRDDLFSTVLRSMFTVFRCFIDGCAAPDGTPIMTYMYNIYRWWAMLVYVVCTLMVSFGLFNIIMAIFVENTLDSARTNESRRLQLKHHEYVKAAHQLNSVILEFVGCEGEDNTSGVTGMSKATFCQIVGHPRVAEKLQDLDISIPRKEDLFEILDADMSGAVSVQELVQGLMKLRGFAGKADSVASLLAIRALQRSLSGLEVYVMRQFANLQKQHPQRECPLPESRGPHTERTEAELNGKPQHQARMSQEQ